VQEATDGGAVTGSEDRRHAVFVLVFGAWLVGFWCFPDGWWHRLALGCAVLPVLWRIRDEWVAVMREERWFRLAAVLLGWQWLTRWWSDEGGNWTGNWLDVALTVTLLGAVLVLGRDVEATRRVLRWMVLAAAVTTVLSLIIFYAHPVRTVAEDRFRNVFVYYGEGLNPNLTGWLCGFGALGAAWACGRAGAVRWAWTWRSSLAVLTFGVLSTQSRGALLMFVAGFTVLLVLEWRKAAAALVTVAVASVIYFGSSIHAESEAVREMVERGSSGRVHFYAWLLDRMDGVDVVIGRGMATPPVIPEEVFGWFVHHPHCAYLAQFYLTGVIGTVLLLALLGWGAWEALQLARKGEALLLILLTGGGVALLFDGGHVLSVFSVGRMEGLMVIVPAGWAVARRGVMGREG